MLDDVLNAVNDYNLVRLPSTMPVATSYQVTRYTYAMNAAHKITKLCLLFKHMLKDPLDPDGKAKSDARVDTSQEKVKKTKKPRAG